MLLSEHDLVRKPLRTFRLAHDLISKPLRTFEDHALQDHASCLSMILSENRYALFGIML